MLQSSILIRTRVAVAHPNLMSVGDTMNTDGLYTRRPITDSEIPSGLISWSKKHLRSSHFCPRGSFLAIRSGTRASVCLWRFFGSSHPFSRTATLPLSLPPVNCCPCQTDLSPATRSDVRGTRSFALESVNRHFGLPPSKKPLQLTPGECLA